MFIITSIQILTLRHEQDQVTLNTSYPSPNSFDEHLDLWFRTPQGDGERYCKEYFPDIPIEVVNL